jgi:peptide/nickel transport system substrate-binding protein
VLVRDGRPLEFEILTNAGNRLRESVLVKIQEQLSKIGVRARPVPLEMQTLAHRCTTGSFDAYLGGWKFSGKLDLKPIFGTSGIPPKGNNVVRYRSTEVDRLLEALARETDWQAMKPGLDAVQRAIHEDQPYTFLYETQRLAAAGPRLQGAEIDIPTDPLARLERFWIKQ